MTWTGVVDVDVELDDSGPEPQHHSVPLVLTPHVRVGPPLTWRHDADPLTCVMVLAVVDPSPSWPSVFVPQHQRESSLRIPQVCALPAVIRRHDVSDPTCVGTFAGPRPPIAFVPAPQHHNVPVARIAHAWLSPAAIPLQSVTVSPLSCAGVSVAVVVLRPSL